MSDHDTRHQILTLLQKNSALSTLQISSSLGFTPTGVRRHLDTLVDTGLAELVPSTDEQQRRGRPTKFYALTDAGRSEFGHAYDSLATMAMRAIKVAGGQPALNSFAQAQAEEVLDLAQNEDPSDDSVQSKAQIIAETLSKKGYSAEVEVVPGGIEICRHHCPVEHVAQEYPELCIAEHKVLAELLGQHALPLATIADGHGICTTHIPLQPIKQSDKEGQK